jgi:hypothetical protein
MNEIITFGKHYSLTDEIKIFVESAKRYCDRVTVIGTELSTELVDYLNSAGVNFIDANELAKRYRVNLSISPYSLKVIFYYLYLNNISTCTNALLCDFTDVFFQKNPFTLIKNSSTSYVGSENFPIKECTTNTTWLRVCYNEDIVNLLSNSDIINSGILLGSIHSCIYTLKEVCNDITSIMSRVGNYPTVDQASFNKCIFLDRENYIVLDNYEFYNLAHSSSASYKKEGNYYVINEHTPFIIHQYDVLHDLHRELRENLYE